MTINNSPLQSWHVGYIIIIKYSIDHYARNYIWFTKNFHFPNYNISDFEWCSYPNIWSINLTFKSICQHNIYIILINAKYSETFSWERFLFILWNPLSQVDPRDRIRWFHLTKWIWVSLDRVEPRHRCRTKLSVNVSGHLVAYPTVYLKATLLETTHESKTCVVLCLGQR